MTPTDLHDWLARHSPALAATVETLARSCARIAESAALGQLAGLEGYTEHANSQGEMQTKLDLFADESIAGALAGFNFADAVTAIIVGAMIVRAGLKFGWEAIRELIDTGLSAGEVAAIRHTIASTPGVLGMHELRTRRMAHQVLVDAHVQVNPRISVSEGHRIAESARQRVLASHPEVLDVLVHVDAENDLQGNAAVSLPDRAILLAHLRELLAADPPDFERTTLHYLSTRVEAEIFLPPGFADDARLAGFRQRLDAALPNDPWFVAIRLNQQIAP